MTKAPKKKRDDHLKREGRANDVAARRRAILESLPVVLFPPGRGPTSTDFQLMGMIRSALVCGAAERTADERWLRLERNQGIRTRSARGRNGGKGNKVKDGGSNSKTRDGFTRIPTTPEGFAHLVGRARKFLSTRLKRPGSGKLMDAGSEKFMEWLKSHYEETAGSKRRAQLALNQANDER